MRANKNTDNWITVFTCRDCDYSIVWNSEEIEKREYCPVCWEWTSLSKRKVPAEKR